MGTRPSPLACALGYLTDFPRLNRRMHNISEKGKLEWVAQIDSKTIVYRHEPDASFWRRVGVAVAAVLPIEWLLYVDSGFI